MVFIVMLALKNSLPVLAATLSIITGAIALVAWGQMENWSFERLSAYRLFPLFGLLAFSIMWSQYVVATVGTFIDTDFKLLARYFAISGYIVLLALLLHPGLLVWQLWQDGFGLPPFSYLQHYVAPSLAWAALLGTGAFLAFMAYEFRRWTRSERGRRWIDYASDVAILAIFIHGLVLGGELQSGWFKGLWWFYGVVLVICLFYLRLWPRLQKATER